MQIIAKNIRWGALMETYQIAKFDCSANSLSRDIVLTHPCLGKKTGKQNLQANSRSACQFLV